MKKLSFLFILFVCGNVVLSQTTARPIVDVKDQPSTKILLERENRSNQGVASSAHVIISEYYGMDDKIKALMVNDQIPADFPKGSVSKSKEEYLTVANAWLSKNKDVLKPQSQNEKLND